MHNLRQRKKLRLKNYDYSKKGFYFVTLCTKWSQNFFGEIINWKMILNDYWKIAYDCWNLIINHYQNIKIDEFIIMPNHIHGIIIITGNKYFDSQSAVNQSVGNQSVGNRYMGNQSVGNEYIRSANSTTRNERTHSTTRNKHTHSEIHSKPPQWNISNIIKWFKIWVTKQVREKHKDWEFWWHKSFFDIIIRDKLHLMRTRQYIINNPLKWEKDKNNLKNNKKFWQKNKKQ